VRDPFDRAVAGLLGAGVLACGAAALALRPAPLPAAAGARWEALAARADREPRINRTWAIDSYAAGEQNVVYAGQVLALRRGEPLAFSGWAFDPEVRKTAARLLYRVDGGAWREARYHLPRPDVPVALSAPGTGDSGFAVEVRTGPLAPGPHELELATSAARGLKPMTPPVRFVVAP
jgi:hypothetical protein